MEMISSNGFCELSQDEMVMVDGGTAWYTVVGNCGFIGCTIGAVALAGTPVGWAALGAATLWSVYNMR